MRFFPLRDIIILPSFSRMVFPQGMFSTLSIVISRFAAASWGSAFIDFMKFCLLSARWVHIYSGSSRNRCFTASLGIFFSVENLLIFNGLSEVRKSAA